MGSAVVALPKQTNRLSAGERPTSTSSYKYAIILFINDYANASAPTIRPSTTYGAAAPPSSPTRRRFRAAPKGLDSRRNKVEPKSSTSSNYTPSTPSERRRYTEGGDATVPRVVDGHRRPRVPSTTITERVTLERTGGVTTIHNT